MNNQTPDNAATRFDLSVIASWIKPQARVLDLGCGRGDLLALLKKTKGVTGTGIEKDEHEVAACIQRGLTVLQGDIYEEIRDYPDDSFDVAVLSQTLQQVYDPPEAIRQLLRVAPMGIVSFPNFSHWRVRLQLLFTGHAPVTKTLPFQWHNTPNIRVITLDDFRHFARDVGFEILKEAAVNTPLSAPGGRLVKILPDLRATYGMFLISRPARRAAGIAEEGV